MAQCMDMEQQDWDVRIEGIGLETEGVHADR